MRNLMSCYRREPSLTDILSDSMVRALMKADGVDPRELEALLGDIARRRGSRVRRA